MSGCAIFNRGIICPDCDDINQIAGVDKEIWVGQISKLDPANPFTVGDYGSHTAYSFATYGGLVKLCGGKKFSNGTTQEDALSETGPNVNTQSINFKVWTRRPEDKELLNEMRGADDLFVIVANNDSTLEVFGLTMNPTEYQIGLRASVNKASGVAAGDDRSFIVTFTGPMPDLAPYFKDTTFAADRAKLDSYVL